MTKPWNMEFNEQSLHLSIIKAIKALSDWYVLPDNTSGEHIVTVEIKKKEKQLK